MYSLLIYFCISLPVSAQIDHYALGARAWGIGNITTTLEDVWAVGNNPAGIASIPKVGIGISYHSTPLMLSNFNIFNLAYAQKLKKGTLGFQASRFGDKIYNETKVGLAYAYTFQKLHVALKTNYVQIGQSTWGSQARLAFEFGAQVPLNKYLKLGAHIYNFTQSTFQDAAGKTHNIPTTLRLGLAYQPINNLSLFAEVEKTLTFAPSPRFGVEYQVHPYLKLRTGIQAQGNTTQQTHTFAQFGGLGVQLRKFELSYTLASQSYIGMGHHLSLQYKLEK